jgi:hypothetical protein
MWTLKMKVVKVGSLQTLMGQGAGRGGGEKIFHLLYDQDKVKRNTVFVGIGVMKDTTNI